MSLKDDDDLVIETDEVDVDNTEEEEVIENTDTPDEEESPETIQDDDEDDEEDRIVTIGDSSEPDAESEDSEEDKEAPGWVKKVRKVNRKLESENKKLKKLLEEKSTEKEKPVELGEKPTLKDCGYDDKKYEQELFNYYERKKRVDEQAAEKERLVQQQRKAWEDRQSKYVNLKQEHGFKDFSYAEELVTETLSTTQQGIIVQGADDSALVVYALGKNPKKLEELSKISDPVSFAIALGKLESQLKVTNKKAPAPEKRVSTGKSGGISGSADKTLERLREEAARTGDMSKVVAYKKKLRNKG